MRNFILGGLLTFFLTGRQDTSPGLILEGNTLGLVSLSESVGTALETASISF